MICFHDSQLFPQRVNTAIMEELKKCGKIKDEEQMKKLVKGKYRGGWIEHLLILDSVNAVRWLWSSDDRVREEWNAKKLCRPSFRRGNDEHRHVSAVPNGTNPWREPQISSWSVSGWYQHPLHTQVSVVTEVFLDLSLPVSDEVIRKRIWDYYFF